MSAVFERHPRLPFELTLTIFDVLSLARDWPTLAAFSCTCRAYFRPARKLLFQEVSLRQHSRSAHVASTRDISRRIIGLCGLLKRDSETRNHIQRFELLDSHPVAGASGWITQLPELVAFIDMLTNIRQCTFGSVLGFLDGRSLPPLLLATLKKLLNQPHLKVLTLYNMSFPSTLLQTSAQYLYINNVHAAQRLSSDPDVAFSNSRLRYLNARMVCLSSTCAVWDIMRIHAGSLKVMKWRCWEGMLYAKSSTLYPRWSSRSVADLTCTDPRSTVNWSYLPSDIDLGQMKALRKLVLRVSFGVVARDLMQLHQILQNITSTSSLTSIELDVSCPAQRTWFGLEDVERHQVWRLLADVLRQSEYSGMRRVVLLLRVHDFKIIMPNETTSTSVIEMQKRLGQSLRDLVNISGLHFKYSVQSFLPEDLAVLQT